MGKLELKQHPKFNEANAKIYEVMKYKLMYAFFEDSMLKENRFIPTPAKERFFKEIKDNLSEATLIVPSNTTLYRARITDDEFGKRVAENILSEIVNNKENDFYDFIDTFGEMGFEYYLKLISEMVPDDFIRGKDEYKNSVENNPFKGYDAQNSGAPPSKFASEGRLNPKGISYLYTAADELTAIHEVKPIIGQDLSIATLSTNRELKIFDLAQNFKAQGVIFGTEKIYRRDTFLKVLSDKFKIPNHGNLTEYIPTQCITEYIKEVLGFDGIRFWSSLKKDGKNIVLFDVSCCDIISTENVSVSEIELTTKSIKLD